MPWRFKARVLANPAIKPPTKEYIRYRTAALLKSWPGLGSKDVSWISAAECLDWSVENASRMSSFSHNYTVGTVIFKLTDQRTTWKPLKSL